MLDTTYQVRPGDSLTSIARRYHTTVEALVRANSIWEPDRIRAGQVLKIQTGDSRSQKQTSSDSKPKPKAEAPHPFNFKAKEVKEKGKPAPAQALQTPLASSTQSQTPRVKKLKLVGPSQREPTRLVACCGWASFQVEVYEPAATPEQKKKTQWLLKDAKKKTLLKHPGKALGDSFILDQIPDDWEGKTIDVLAYCQSPSDDVKVTFTVETRGEVGRFIKLVRKVEATYPTWSGERVLNALRRLAGYDDRNFRNFYGGLAVADALTPTGSLTQVDIDALRDMTRHSVTGTVELGIAKDSLGEAVALGHVLTGISAGQHRNRSIDLTPSWSAGAGERMDNLYATTIAGDLGQTAVFVEHRGEANYIGPGTDATDAELVGDIDGFLLGNNLGLYTGTRSLFRTDATGIKLSELLHIYYCIPSRKGAPANTAADRFTRFSRERRATLLDQTKRFATNYAYASEGKWDGMWSDADDEASENSVNAFWDWLTEKAKQEKAP